MIDDDDSFSFGEYAVEDYVAVGVFWLLGLDVFAQFFSRYVMQGSIAWTEEAARYLLICMTFLGSALAVRKGGHIAVEMSYRHMTQGFARFMARLVETGNIIFFAVLAVICWKVAERTFGVMVSVPMPKKALYYVVFTGLAVMTLRAALVAVASFRGRRVHEAARLSTD